MKSTPQKPKMRGNPFSSQIPHPSMGESDKARFWSKVEKTEAGCWEWSAGKSGKKYGRFKLNGKLFGAQRVAYFLVNGDYSPSLFVCHKCDNPPCVNPSHLFLGTRSENMLDCQKKGRLKIPRKLS